MPDRPCGPRLLAGTFQIGYISVVNGLTGVCFVTILKVVRPGPVRSLTHRLRIERYAGGARGNPLRTYHGLSLVYSAYPSST